MTVGTNSANGYQLTMYADNPSLTSTTQINGKTYAINTLSGSVSSAEFADSAHAASMNKWGFTTNGSVYYVATCEPNAICYAGNGGTGGMGVQTATSNAETTLCPPTFRGAATVLPFAA